MKRFFCILLAICFVISLTACGDPTPQKIDEETVKVVLVCAGDLEEETSMAAMYEEQLETAAQMIGLDEEQYAVCDGVSDKNSALAEDAIKAYIKAGYSVVFGTETGYAQAMKNLAAEYPRVTFVQIGDADETLPNYYAYRVKTYEGAFLCGLVAGEFSENGKLGMIVDDLDDVENHQLANAFLLGAQVRRPSATLMVGSGKNGDYTEALSKIAKDECNGVLIAVDDKQTVNFAKTGGLQVYTMCGRPSDEDVLYRVNVQHTTQLVDTLQEMLSQKTPRYNNTAVGYADGFLRCENTNGDGDFVMQAYMLSDAAKTYLKKGEWNVFAGVKLAWDGTVNTFAESPAAVKDTDGTVRIPAGAGTPTAETLNGMDWWMQGITVLNTEL